MKQLILMRHAKSSWNQPELTDFERPLNKRGVIDSSNMGKWMASHLSMPELILCSTARRAQQTMQLFLLALRAPDNNTSSIEQNHIDALYLASASTLKQHIESAFEQYNCVMVIAHNPGMDDLLLHYCPDFPLTFDNKVMTTANIAAINFDTSFTPSLNAIQRPKDI